MSVNTPGGLVGELFHYERAEQARNLKLVPRHQRRCDAAKGSSDMPDILDRLASGKEKRPSHQNETPGKCEQDRDRI